MGEEPLGYGWLFDPPVTHNRGERTLSVRMDTTRLGSQVAATTLFFAAFFIASDPRLLGTGNSSKSWRASLEGLGRLLKLPLLCAILTFAPFWAWTGFSRWRDELVPILPWWFFVYLSTVILCYLAATKRSASQHLPSSEDVPLQPTTMHTIVMALLVGGGFAVLMLLFYVANL